MKREEARKLLQRYLDGKCSLSEAKLVESWLDHQVRTGIWQWDDEEDILYTREKIKKHIRKNIYQRRTRVIRILKPISVAACILFISIAGFLFWDRKDQGEHLAVAQDIHEVVEPGTPSATLTLGDGSVIRLDSLTPGSVLQNDYLNLVKNSDRQLSYEQNDIRTARVDTNMVTIPVGGQYKVVLPDGTKVSLNSASTLVYTTRFTGDTRSVKLQGEAYFEVSPNKQQPFVVTAGDTETKVTGTSFNVSAYAEEGRTVTTLLEGEVYVKKEKSEVRLLPGEQSVSLRGQPGVVKKNADTEASIAWTQGYFSFDDQQIESVLRNIARWYDVDIYVQQGKNTGKRIGGTFSRSKSVEELLLYLDKLNVLKFKKDERRITVML